jgi:SAM-dependent methyltransferase
MMDSTAWDERYAASDLVWSAGPNAFLPPLVESMAPGSALDIACGEGRNAIWLARQGWDVTGVDFSAAGIAKAEQLSQDTDVNWVVADVVSYEPNSTFDLVIVFYLHLVPGEFAEVFTHAVDALVPGGTLFGVGHALRNLEDGYGGPSAPEILWSDDLFAPMTRNLDVIELGERTRFVPDADATAIDFVIRANKSLSVDTT